MNNNIKKGRPLGSKNKVKDSVRTLSLSKYIENSPIINDEVPYEWVTYGRNNDFPDMLLDLYYNSPTHKACVDFIVSAIMGEGLDWEKMKLNGAESYPNFNETWETFIEKILTDYVIFGSFSFQVIMNKDGKTYSYYHQPVSTVRLGKKENDGDIMYAYLCKDWHQHSKYKPTRIDIFNFTDDVKIQKSKPYLFYFSNHNPFDAYYGSPSYASALDAIRADIELGKYDLNSVTNLFTPSGMLTLNRVEDETERTSILKNIENLFTGSDNAGRIIVSFKNSDSDSPIQFTPFAAPSEGVNLFADTNERNINRILASHKIPNKALIGMPMDASGFSNEGSLLEASYNLCEKVTVGKQRRMIFDYINKMFAMNGIDTRIEIIPLTFNLSNVEKENTNDSIAESNNIGSINDENIEQVENNENEQV